MSDLYAGLMHKERAPHVRDPHGAMARVGLSGVDLDRTLSYCALKALKHLFRLRIHCILSLGK